jgi:NAD(P)-dependent dehydrogenase (short-subunit alcohol dehydrogenase family)
MKYAVIVGASSSIGENIAKTLLDNKYNLILTYNNNEINKEIFNNKLNIEIIKCDVTKEEDIINLYEKAKNKNIELLINAQAICLDNYINDKTKEEFMKVLEVNLVGTFLTTKYMLKIMKKGDIINISSLDSTKSFNNYSVDYIASKAGVNSLVKTMSLDYKDIRFISILLPFVDTSSIREMNEELLKEEMNKYNQKRLMTVSEVSNKIITIINDKTIKSGSIIEVEDF